MKFSKLLLITLLLISNHIFGCHNSTINSVSSVLNGDGTRTFTINVSIDVGSSDGYSYGFALLFSNTTASAPSITNISSGNITKSGYNPLSPYYGGTIGSGGSSPYFNSRYSGRTDVLTYESNDGTWGFGSTDYNNNTVVVTLSGCVETITLDADVRSMTTSASAVGACVKTYATGLTCCTPPTAALSGTQTICQGASANLNINLTGTGPWSVDYSDGSSTTTISSIASSPYTLSVSPSSTTTYTLVSVSNTCTGTVSGTATVTVTPSTTPTFTPPANLCQGGTAYTLPTSSEDAPAITGSWNSVTAPATNSGMTTYTFTPNTGQCANNTTMNITVDPSVTPTFTAVPPICSGDALAALPTTSNNGINGTWSPAINNTATTTYTFTPTAGQCANTTTMTITVNPILTPTISCGTSTSTSVQFNWAALTGATNYAITYTVNGGASQSGGSTATPTFSLSSLNPGDAVVITIVTTGTGCYANGTGNCTAQACTAPTITTQPAAQSACEGQTATFSVTATGASGYQWEISTDGGSTFTTLNDGGVYAGATTATLSISDNTGLDANQYRVVVAESNALCPTTSNAALLTATSIETPTVTCGTSTSSSVQFNWAALTGATNYAITYTVNGGTSQSGGSTASPTFSLSSLNPGDAVVITIVTTGTACYANGTGSCTAQACTAPTITTQPLDQTVCASSSTTFNVTATGASGYQWEISTDGGSTFTTLNDGGVYSGTTTSTLSISNCTGLNSLQYRAVIAESIGTCPVISNPAILYSNVIETPNITCGTSTVNSVQFNWSPLTGATNYAISYTVNGGASQSGGSTTSPTFSLNGLNPTDAVTITVITTGTTACYANGTASCSADPCISPTINSQPISQSLCEGNPITFNVSATGASGYQWEISTDGGSTFTTLNDGGVYSDATTATLSVSDNTGLNANQYRVVVAESNTLCPITSNTAILTVNSTPSITGVLSACPSQTSQLVASTTGSSISPWISSNNSAATIDNNGLLTAVAVGTSLITFTDNNGCIQTATVNIPSNETPIISCGINTTSSVTFDWTTPLNASDYDITYTINGGLTQIAGNQTSTSYTINGLSVDDQVDITITTNGSGCYQLETQTCFAASCIPSIASFLPDPKTITSQDPTTNLINSSQNATGYYWDFGDGTTSTATSPSHQYEINENSTYDITLIAYNIDGCNDTVTQTVIVKEELIYYVPNSFTPNGDEYNNEFKPVFYSGHDPYSYSMLIFNRWGQIVFETYDISKGWTGTYGSSDKIAQDGVYTWKIEFKEKGIDKKVQITGHVILSR